MCDLKGISGCGIGLRSEHILDVIPSGFSPDWSEITPENWMHLPYHYKEAFEEVVSKLPIMAYGLSLSIGSPEALDMGFLKELKADLDRVKKVEDVLAERNIITRTPQKPNQKDKE